MDTDTNRAMFDSAFAQIAAVIQKETHNDASLFTIVAESIVAHPPFASVLAYNIASILDETESEVDYGVVLLEAYRRTLFAHPSEDHLQFDMFEGSGEKAQEFADLISRLSNLDTPIATSLSKFLN